MTSLLSLARPTLSAATASRYVALVACALVTSPIYAQPTAPAADGADVEEATGLQTIAAAALSGYRPLMEDVRFIGKLAGYPGAADMAEGMLAMATQGLGLEGLGLDASRPLGVILQTDGAQFVPLGCLPVADMGPAMDLIEATQLPYEELEDGVVQIEMPDRTIYLKSVGDWTYIAMSPEAFDAAPADPLPVLTDLVKDYDLGVRAFVQKVPPMYRQVALGAMRSGMEQGMEQQDGESDEDYEARIELAEAQIDQLSALIEEVDELTIGWNLDEKNENTYLDIAITALPETDMGLALSTYNESNSAFAGFFDPKAAMGMVGASKLPPELAEKQRAQTEATIAVLRKQIEKGIEDQKEFDTPDAREKLRSAATDLMDAYEALMSEGRTDIAATVHLESAQGASLVAAAYVPTPDKIESAFKTFTEVLATKPGFPGVEWDADSHAGIRMHRLSMPLPPEAAASTPLLGDKIEVSLGVGTDAVFIAAGADSVSLIKAAFDDSRARDGEPMPPFEVYASIGQIIKAVMPVAEPEAKPAIQMVLDALKDQPEGTDHVRFSGTKIEKGIRMRYEAESGVLKALAAAAVAAQQQAAGGF